MEYNLAESPGISLKKASEEFDKLSEALSTSGFDVENSQTNESVKKKCYRTIDEEVEAQWGNRQSKLRSAVNRFWKEKLKRQKYI